MISKDNIPTTWEIITIRDVAKNEKYSIVDGPFGTQMKVHEFVSHGIPLIEMQNINKDKFISQFRRFITNNKFEEIKRSSVTGGDILISKTGSLGYVAIVPKTITKAIITSRLAKISVNWNFINQGYIYNYLLFLREKGYWEKIAKGTTMKILNVGQLAETKFPLPPLAEQQRIVDKIEELFSDLDKGIESLKTAQQQLRVYRQAVLKWAFEGKLTEEWRKQQINLNSASQLINQIELEKEKYSKVNKIKIKKLPQFMDDELSELPELSNGRSWVKIDVLSENDKHSIKAGPFGSSLKKEVYVPNGYKIYGQEQVIAGDAHFGDYFIDEIKYKELNSCKVKSYDILISLVGTIGKVLILPEDAMPGIINPRLIKISLNRKYYLPTFFKYYFESSFLKVIYKQKAHGATMDVLNLGIIQELPFPLCSLQEQQQIIDEIESRLSVCDKIEESITQSLEQAEALRQSILKKAFEGKLVPQDPSDEPASVLLERIRSERGDKPAQKSKRTKQEVK